MKIDDDEINLPSQSAMRVGRSPRRTTQKILSPWVDQKRSFGFMGTVLKASRNQALKGGTFRQAKVLWMILKERIPELSAEFRREKEWHKRTFSGNSDPMKFPKTYTLSPTHWFPKLLTFMRGMSIIIILYFCPMQFGFRYSAIYEDEDTISILLFWLDLFYIFRCILRASVFEYFDKWGVLIKSHRAIFRHFFSHKTALISRVLLAVPFYWIDVDWCLLKMVCFFEISALFYFFKVIVDWICRLIPYSLSSRIKKVLITKFLNNCLVIYMIAHFVSCCFIRIDQKYSGDVDKDYIDSFYFVLSTAATIGYGDVTVQHQKTSRTEYRYLFATLVILFAISFFVHVQSFISRMIESWNYACLQESEIISGIDDWLAVRNQTPNVCISWSYEKKVKEYYVYLKTSDFNTVLKSNSYFEQLDYDTQMMILGHVTEDFRHKFQEFFNTLNMSCAIELSFKCSLVNFNSKDIVLKRKQKPKGIYFILDGAAGRVRKGEKLDILHDGHYFGDSCLINMGYDYNVICEDHLICLFLPKSAVDEHFSLKQSGSFARCKELAENRYSQSLCLKKWHNYRTFVPYIARQINPLNQAVNPFTAYEQAKQAQPVLQTKSKGILGKVKKIHSRQESEKSNCKVDDDSDLHIPYKEMNLFHELRPPWEKNLRVLKNDKPINKFSIHKQSASSISSGKDKGVYLLVEPKEKLPKPVDDDVLLTLPNDVPETPDNPVDKIEMPSPDPFFAELPESQCPKRHLLETEKSMSQDKNSEAVSKVNNLAMQSENIDYDNIEGDDSASTISNEEVHEKASLCGDSVDDSDDMEDIRASLDTKDWPHSLSSMLEIIEAKLGYVRIKYSNFLDRLEKEHAFVATDVLHTINRIKTAPLLVAVNTLVHQHPRPNL
jgi:hypothetical protein